MASVGLFLVANRNADNAILDGHGRKLNELHSQGAPYTYFFRGSTLRYIKERRPLIYDKMLKMFPEECGEMNPDSPEIGTTGMNSMPLVPLGSCESEDERLWDNYMENVTCPEIDESRRILKDGYGKSPKGLFPPECIFNLKAAKSVSSKGFDYVIIDGTKLNDHSKKKIFNIGGVKLVPRNDKIRMWRSPEETVDDIRRYMDSPDVRYSSGDKRVVIGGTLNFGDYGLSASEGTRYLCRLADMLYASRDLELHNISSIAESCRNPEWISTLDSNGTTSWIGNGDIECFNGKNGKYNDMVNNLILHYVSLKKRVDNIRSSGRYNGNGELDDISAYLDKINALCNEYGCVNGRLNGKDMKDWIMKLNYEIGTHDLSVTKQEMDCFGCF